MQLHKSSQVGKLQHSIGRKVAQSLVEAVTQLGAALIELVAAMGRYVVFMGAVLKRIVTPPWRWRLILDQGVAIGVKSFPIALLTSLFVGAVMVIQTGIQLVKFGSKNYVPGISFIANAREMVPVFCAIVVGARVAASITAELGSMKVTEQIDAMDVLNVDPYRYLAVPRVIVMTLMFPMICIICLATGVLGGMIVADAALNIEYAAYYKTTVSFASLTDIFGGWVKTFFFGFIIALTGCYCGFSTEGGAAGVGRSTTRSVVLTLILVLGADYLLTSLILTMVGIG